MLKKLIKNTSWLIVAEVVSKGAYALVFLLIGRIFGIAALGRVSFAYALCSLLFVVANFGFSELATREIARDIDKTRDYISTMLILKVGLAAATLILVYITILLMGKPPEVNFLILLFTLFVIFNSFNMLSASVFRGHEQMHKEAIVRFLEGATLVILSGSLFYVKSNLSLVVGSFAISATLAFSYSLAVIHKDYSGLSLKFDRALAKEIMTEAWPFAFASVFILVYFKIDTVMLALMKSDVVVGAYGASYNLIYGALVIPTFLNAAIYPTLSKSHNNMREIKRAILLYSAGVLSIGILVYLFFLLSAPFLINLIYSRAEYDISIFLLRVLALVLPFLFINSFLGTMLMAINRQKLNLYVMIALTFTNVGLNYYLIPSLAAYGASLATVITEVVGTVLFLFLIFKIKIFNISKFQRNEK